MTSEKTEARILRIHARAARKSLKRSLCAQAIIPLARRWAREECMSAWWADHPDRHGAHENAALHAQRAATLAAAILTLGESL